MFGVNMFEGGVVAIGIGAEVRRSFQRWLFADRPQFTLRCFGFDPPCDLAQVYLARLIIVDGTAELVMAVAECGRLRLAARPMVLIANDALAVQAPALRAGAKTVLQSPVSRRHLERCMTEHSLRGAPGSGPRPATRGRFLAPGVILNRDARTLWVDGNEVTLSAQKFDLLCYLVDRTGAAVCAADLVREGLLRPSQAQRYKGLIQELKRHLKSARDMIRAVPGYGYRLDLLGKPNGEAGVGHAVGNQVRALRRLPPRRAQA